MHFLVVGAGLQGRVVAANLAARPDTQVQVADLRAPTGLPKGCVPLALDAMDAVAVKRACADVDAVVLALPGSIANKALHHLVRVGAPTVDVSFTPESPASLHAAAQHSGACVVTDMGVAPGLSHVLVARSLAELGGADRVTILVGGMPVAPPPVFRHAVYFNARDLMDEYIRPARMRRDGRDVAPHPLDGQERRRLVDEEVGALESFPSDGLRSLLASFPDVRDMEELTLRVPGHLDAMTDLHALGLLDGDASTDGLAAALAKHFAGDAHPDRLLMEVWVEHRGEKKSWRVHDTRMGGMSAMARTTGFTVAAATVLLATKRFTTPGVHAPEAMGRDPKTADALVAGLAAAGVKVTPGTRLRIE